MKLTLKHGHPWMNRVLTCTAKALFSDATNNLQYQFLYDHVRIATAVEVSRGSYVARSSELVK